MLNNQSNNGYELKYKEENKLNMITENNNLKVSTPGRICLFGEHQDYLGLPIIAAGISRRVTITGARRDDKLVTIYMPDIDDKDTFEITDEIKYVKPRDYFRSVVNVLQREGYRFSSGFDLTIKGDIPINSGTSSSSALIVTWVNFLIQMADNYQPVSQQIIGELAYQAEVLEFGEPGGMMDQYSTALGNIIYMESEPKISINSFSPALGTFVLGDSKEPKDTINILKHVKFGMLDILKKIGDFDPEFDLKTSPKESVQNYVSLLTDDELLLLAGNLSDRDVLLEAKEMFEKGAIDDVRFGKLLTIHQNSLRDAKKVSTPKINRMIDASLKAGALGAKINGSGGGGCMFAYAPKNPELVAEAIEKEGGIAYIITIGDGTKVDR
jgi:galactokinase